MSVLRQLSGTDDSLAEASIARIIGTGCLLGVVHVLTGPDHMSALAAMTVNSSWKAFALGIRWGCGHSIGLLIMAAIFFAAGQSFDLNEVGAYCNYVVGVFMIALGLWTAVHIRRKYQDKLKDSQVLLLPSGVTNHASDSSGSVLQPTALPPMERVFSSGNERGSSERKLEIMGSPLSSFHLVTLEDGEQSHDRASENYRSEETFEQKPKKCCGNTSFSNPTTQRITALLVGIVHGIAGPGGILGVLPAVVMDDWGKSVAYLASFCFSSIFVMGVFAALYGEITARLSRNSTLIEFRMGMFSAAFSLIVGVAWIILQATGKLDDIFELYERFIVIAIVKGHNRLEPSMNHEDENDSSTMRLLQHSSLWMIILTALSLGAVHVFTGPDHISALAALSNGKPWLVSFILGIQWGCGHSIGIVVIAVICLVIGHAIDLGLFRSVCVYMAGIFLVVIGCWTWVQAKREYERRTKPPPSPSNWRDVKCTDASYVLLSVDNLQTPPGSEDDGFFHNLFCWPFTSISESNSPGRSHAAASVCVGILHGVAGPGGVLGVLPVVALHHTVHAIVYLASFCLSSIVCMGGFAMLYGEITKRSSASSAVIGFRIGVASSALSIVVGIAWILLQAFGVLDSVFGHQH